MKLSHRNLIYFKVLTLSFFLISSITSGQTEKRTIHPLTGSVTISTEAGGALGFTDYKNSKGDFIWRGSLEYFFDIYSDHLLGLKGFFGTGNINGTDDRETLEEFKTDLTFFGAGINYGYWISDKVLPTLFAGVSNVNFNPNDRSGNPLPNNSDGAYEKNGINLNLELGLRYFVTNDFSLSIGGGAAQNFNDLLDDVEKGRENDVLYAGYLGLSYTINANGDSDNDGIEDSRDLCPETPEGLAVNSDGCSEDSDNDGVPDYVDVCPNTADNILVDESGCPRDTDLDGVPDFADRCPNTPPDIKVSRFGCAIDSDFDGIPDHLDRCPNTLEGVRVDNEGCAADSDGDGVADFEDKCPNTDLAVIVNSSGCPLDSDADGVPDHKDKCPNTPVSTSVSADGCSNEFSEYIFRTEALFNGDEVSLLPSASLELRKVISKIKRQPNASWRIEGYTDNVGSAEHNKVLSFRRAQAVYNYFVSQKLNRNRFEVVGMGDDFPIADNTTEEGRNINSRVVLVRID